MALEPMTDDYRQFAESSPAMRKVTLQFMRLNPEVNLSFFKQVYQYETDPDLRQMAYDVLVAQGITPIGDGASLSRPADVPLNSSPIGSSSPLADLTPNSSALRDSGIGGLPAKDALSRNEAQLRRTLAVDNAPVQHPLTTGGATTMPQRPGELDDGTGRPERRGPHLESVFTLHRGNSAYLTGNTDRVASDFGSMMLVAAFMIVMQIVFYGTASASVTSRTTGAETGGLLIITGIGAIFVAIGIRSLFVAKRFHKQGILLIGQILSASGRWVITGSGKSRSRKYRVTIRYRVRTPRGEVIEDNANASRNDLARKTLPQPGDPIAVLLIPDTKKIRVL